MRNGETRTELTAEEVLLSSIQSGLEEFLRFPMPAASDRVALYPERGTDELGKSVRKALRIFHTFASLRQPPLDLDADPKVTPLHSRHHRRFSDKGYAVTGEDGREFILTANEPDITGGDINISSPHSPVGIVCELYYTDRDIMGRLGRMAQIDRDRIIQQSTTFLHAPASDIVDFLQQAARAVVGNISS